MATTGFLRLRGVERGRAGAPLDCFAELAKRGSPHGWTKGGLGPQVRNIRRFCDGGSVGSGAEGQRLSARTGLRVVRTGGTVPEEPDRQAARRARASAARGPLPAARAR